MRSIRRSSKFIQLGMFAGTQKSTEADFEIAQFQGYTDTLPITDYRVHLT